MVAVFGEEEDSWWWDVVVVRTRLWRGRGCSKDVVVAGTWL